MTLDEHYGRTGAASGARPRHMHGGAKGETVELRFSYKTDVVVAEVPIPLVSPIAYVIHQIGLYD